MPSPLFRAGKMLYISILLTGLNAAATPLPESALESGLVEQGRRIYTDGMLDSGELLQGTRANGTGLSGHDAACTNCHRASGMGSVEGNVRVSPINGRFLFSDGSDLLMSNMDGQRGKRLNQSHKPYTEASFQRAIQQGVNVSGISMGSVMPRYDLKPEALLALKAYLMELSADYSPGVTKETIRFATIITPEVSDSRKKVFTQMLNTAVTAKNSSTSPRKRYMTSAATFVTQTERRWEHEIWELKGDSKTWGEQLKAHYRQAPVFALLSGLSDTSWQPVADFCNQQKVPCWFPSTQFAANNDIGYGLYFSKGVELEAQVIAKHLMDHQGNKSTNLINIYSPDTLDEIAAQNIHNALKSETTHIVDFKLDKNTKNNLQKLLNKAKAEDVVVLWITKNQLELLDGILPPNGAIVYLSGELINPVESKDMNKAWKSNLLFVYPFQLPSKRDANMAYLHAWLKMKNIDLIDEKMQSEVFFSLNLMTDTLQDMLDNLYRDYLIERTEDMLGKRESMKSEQESRDRKTLGRLASYAVNEEMKTGSKVNEASDSDSGQRRAFGVGTSDGTTIYPRLMLGPGQRYASRGAYIVKYDANGKQELTAETDWIVP